MRGCGRYRRHRNAIRTNLKETRVSYLIFDALLPWLGHDAASYWAHLLVIDPI